MPKMSKMTGTITYFVILVPGKASSISRHILP